MRRSGLDKAQAGIKTAGEIWVTSDTQMTQILVDFCQYFELSTLFYFLIRTNFHL